MAALKKGMDGHVHIQESRKLLSKTLRTERVKNSLSSVNRKKMVKDSKVADLKVFDVRIPL